MIYNPTAEVTEWANHLCLLCVKPREGLGTDTRERWMDMERDECYIQVTWDFPYICACHL